MNSYVSTFPVRSIILYDKVQWTILGYGYHSNHICLGTHAPSDRYRSFSYENNTGQEDRKTLIPEAKKFPVCFWVHKDVSVSLISLPINIPGQKCSICQTSIEHQTDKVCVFCAAAKIIEA